MADQQKDRQQYALQTIFSFFLGLMVLAFIGIGVNTFYTEPDFNSPEMEKLYREQDRLYRGDDGKMTPEDDERLAEIQEELEVLNTEAEQVRNDWARNTSIVLILFATMVMGVSLIRSEQLRVISNGLLLGGLFTMVYGVGWIIFSGESVARFVVIVFALLVTLALGYLRFVRGKASEGVTPIAAAPGGGAMSIPDAGELTTLVARINALEARTAAAAAALREGTD